MSKMVPFLIRLLSRLSEGAAARLLSYFFSIPRTFPMRPEWQEQRSAARRIEFQRGGRRVAWQWGDQGPLVVCVHGWEGTGAQFGRIGSTLAQQGCRCVSIDLTAHGESDGRRAQFSDFPKDITALADHLDEPVAAYVCHSAGGMVLMAAREASGISADRYVVIAAPSAPYPPIEFARKMLAPSEQVLDRLRTYLSGQFSNSWESLMSGHLYAHNTDGELLLIYDESDRAIDHRQGDVIQRLWPESRLIKTKGLGHNRILWDEDVVHEIVSFVSPPCR
jgi:pimeloyl-ACP methyl ester carboxylesterase